MVENKRCVLIADDEPKMVRALRDFFRASGFCVLETKDGVEALDVFCENSNVIDIILLDVMMPLQDGLTLEADSGILLSHICHSADRQE